MSTDIVFRPVNEYLEQGWPDLLPELPEAEILEEIWIEPPGISGSGANAGVLDSRLMFQHELPVTLPGLDAVALVLAPGGGGTVVGLELQVTPELIFRLVDVPVALRLDASLLKPVRKVSGGTAFEPDPNTAAVEITLARVTVSIDSEGNVDLDFSGSLDLPPCMIGDSQIVVEANDLKLYLGASSPAGKPADWRGLTLANASLYLPDPLSRTLGAVQLSDATIGNGGFSGTVSTSWGSGQAVDLFGMDAALSSVSLTFVQNALTQSTISGTMTLPFFDEDVEVRLGLDIEGNLTAQLAGQNGLSTVTRQNLFEFAIESLGFSTDGEVPAVTLGGTLTPQVDLFPDAPGVQVNQLTIDADGNVDLEGGWLDLPDQYRTEIGGLGFEITKFGMGHTDSGRKWVGLNGGIQLPEGLPAGASVEGLRIFLDGNQPAVTLNGIGVEFTVPETLAFKGEVSWRGQAFRGDIDLELMALGMTIEAELVFGTASQNGQFTYMAIYIDANLPAGIPLWATGLSLYGFAGLFAHQYAPNKKENQKWYAIAGGDQSWYHWQGKGVTDITSKKWQPKAGALGFGAGVTVATAADNGLSVANDLLLVIVFPGPIIMLQGRTDLLKKGTAVSSDALFQTLAVLDGRAGSLTLGMDARYKEGKKGRLLDISASAEAFYSLNDPDDWYLNIGKKKPRDQRIRAEALSIFQSEAYFMLDPNRLAMGIWRGYGDSWKYGPLKVTLEAWVASDVLVNFEPAHFHGAIELHGKAALSAFGVGLGLTVDTKIAADVFDPFHLLAQLAVSLSTPWPLPDPSAKVTLEWGPRPDPPQLPDLIDQIGIGHKKLAATWQPKPDRLQTQANQNALAPPSQPDGQAPVVPLDARPEITFRRPVHNRSSLADNQNPPSPPREVIGDPARNEGPAEVKYELIDVRLCRWDRTAGIWTDVPDLHGTWAPLPRQPKQGERDTQAGRDGSLTQTKLLLQSRTPFAYSRHTDGSWEEAFADLFPDYPCPIELVCYDFEGLRFDRDFEGELAPDPEFFNFQRADQGQAPWLTISVKKESGWTAPVDVPLNVEGDALAFKGEQLRATSRSENRRYTHHLEIWIPHTLRSVQLRLSSGKYASQGTVIARDREGQPHQAEWFIPDAFADHRQQETREFVFTAEGTTAISLLELDFVGQLHIVELCTAEVDLAQTWDEAEGRWEQGRDAGGGPSVSEKIKAQIKAQRAQLARWEDAAQVLEPYSAYHLAVITRIHGVGREGFDWEHQVYQARYAEFQTAGPPALSIPDRPASAGNQANGSQKQEIGLETLARYVHQTSPKTVPAKGEQPPLPRPVYRTDPVGVDFNEDYVHLLYKLARRDLRIYLYDQNNRPVRDVRGRLVVAENPLGETEALLLDRATRRWFAHVEASGCLGLDGLDIEMTKRLETRQVLGPDRVYEARLSPLLLHETFAPGGAAWTEVDQRPGSAQPAPNWGIDGHDGFEGSRATHLTGRKLTLGVTDAAAHLTPHLDVIEIEGQSGTETFIITGVDPTNNNVTLARQPSERYRQAKWRIPARHTLRQEAQVGAPAQSVSVADRLQASAGAIWKLAQNPDLAAGDSDQPQNWTDFRATFRLGTLPGASGVIGCVFRYAADDTHYRFTMSNIAGYRRLVRFANGIAAQVWEVQEGYRAGDDYVITIEAIGPRIQVLVGREPVLTVTDPGGPDRGTIGLYTRATDQALFKEIQVDDFRTGMPVAYRFQFTTSLFTDARHQIHSYNDETWLGTYPAQTISAIASLPSLSDPPDAEEFRHFQAVAVEIQGAQQRPERLEVTRLEDEGTTKGFLLKSPEPIDWGTTELTLSRAARYDDLPTRPGALKLIDATLQPDRAVSLLLRWGGDLSGYTIEYRTAFGIGFSSGSAPPFSPSLGRAGRRSALRRVGSGNIRFEQPPRTNLIPPTWRLFHTFKEEPPLPAGTRIDIGPASAWGSSSPPPRSVRWSRNGPALNNWPSGSVQLRVRTPTGEPRHRRQFRPPSDYGPVGQVAVLRSRDGTGLLLLKTSGFQEGQYRLTFSPAGSPNQPDQLAQPVFIDIPWDQP